MCREGCGAEGLNGGVEMKFDPLAHEEIEQYADGFR